MQRIYSYVEWIERKVDSEVPICIEKMDVKDAFRRIHTAWDEASVCRIVDRREKFQYSPSTKVHLLRVGWSVGKTDHVVKTPISARSHV